MLFSEPKIPQLAQMTDAQLERAGFSALQRAENSSTLAVQVITRRSPCFSALQRAENSSTVTLLRTKRHISRFQCSSASRKFLNRRAPGTLPQAALQFQCSSASRKFLNRTLLLSAHPPAHRFSALQRAENSSTELSPRSAGCV